jgi:hypothetical protein
MYYCGITGKGPEDQLGEPQLWEEHTSESCIYIFSFFESFFFLLVSVCCESPLFGKCFKPLYSVSIVSMYTTPKSILNEP